MPKRTGKFIKGATFKQQMSASTQANKKLISSGVKKLASALRSTRKSSSSARAKMAKARRRK